MDKNKSEKLKEILNQTLTTEDIEKKLKAEIRNNALKKEKIKEDENLNKKSEEEPKKEEELVIPSIREKKKENKGLNTLLYLVIIIAILLFSIVIYLFTSKKEDLSSETNIQTAKEKSLKKDDNTENLILMDNDKKKSEKNILIINAKKEASEKEILETSKKVSENKIEKEKAKETIKIKEIIKEKIVTKTIKLDKKNFKEYYNASKYNSLKCYNFKAGDIFPSSQCKNNLKKFLLANKNAIRFEVIPVIAESDNLVFNKMQSKIKDMDKDFQSKVKEYMFKGLSRERVLETSWNIKDILGEDTILTPTNYYVKSKKNNKGVIIKAYH